MDTRKLLCGLLAFGTIRGLVAVDDSLPEPQGSLVAPQEEEPVFQVSFLNVSCGEKKQASDPDEIIVGTSSKFGLRLTFNDLKIASFLMSEKDFLAKIVKQGLEDFSVEFAGESFSSVQVGSSEVREHIMLDFMLRPKREGALRLGPFECRVGQSKHSSPAVRVTVKNSPVSDKRQACFATLELEGGTDCFVWQQKKLRLKIFFDPTEVQVRPLNLEGFNIPDFEFKQLGQTAGKEVVGGRAFQTVSFDYAVTPKTPGLHEIPAIEIAFLVRNKDPRMAMGGFFNGFLQDMFTMTESFSKSNCLHVNVLDLPASGKNVAALGTFTDLTLSLGNKRECERSEPVILKLTLEGTGDFSLILHPDLDLPSFVKHYPSQASFTEIPGSSGLSGKKEFEYVLQIDSAGETLIPAQTFEFFDPNKKEFVTLTSQSQKIFVRGKQAAVPQAIPSSGQGNAILPEHSNTPQNNRLDFEFHKPVSKSFFAADRKISWNWFFIQQILLFFAALLWWLQGYIAKAYRRRYRLGISLKRLHNMAAAGDLPQFYRIIMSYFACKLGVEEGDISFDILLDSLQKRYRIPDKIWKDFLQFMHQCQEVSFGYRKVQATELRTLIVLAEKWLKIFEKLFKTGTMQEKL